MGFHTMVGVYIFVKKIRVYTNLVLAWSYNIFPTLLITNAWQNNNNNNKYPNKTIPYKKKTKAF